MAENIDRDDLPQATVVRKKGTRISVVWIIPILAAVVAIGIAIQRIMSEGPTITIVFKAAEGFEAGKTFIKYKDVNIGQVTAVKLSTDHSKVEVTAKIDKSAAGLMVEDAKFWVVEPRVTLSGVSGLGTLLSGNYIGFEVGKSDKTAAQVHRARGGADHHRRSSRAGSSCSRPKASARWGSARRSITAACWPGRSSPTASQPTARRSRSRFSSTRPTTNTSIPAHASGTRAASMRRSARAEWRCARSRSVAVLAGGLAFDTPTFAAKTEPAAADTVFTLYTDQATAMKQPESISARYVLHFNESLRGLSVGAPVTLLGLPAGEVTDVGLAIDPATMNTRGRVEMVSFPERLVARLGQSKAAIGKMLEGSAQQRHAFMQRLVEQRGLRAQLRSGNLLTGQLFVAFDFFPNAPKAKIDWSREPVELPVMPEQSRISSKR